MLDTLSCLLTAQAGECRLERLLLAGRETDLAARLQMGREAAHVRRMEGWGGVGGVLGSDVMACFIVNTCQLWSPSSHARSKTARYEDNEGSS